MNHLNLIFSTAQRLQASRSFLRDLRGLDKTSEGVEFAKAIGEAAALGATPEDVVEQVVKAMAGNETMALEVLTAVQEIAKAHIEQHTRTLASGKTVNVKAYETARTGAMKQTTLAHGATFHAMRTKTPEAHENAAAAHEAAAQQHGAAHEVHPMDVPEVGKEHANLKAQHLMSAEFHRQESASMRHGHGYAVQASRAATASQGTKTAITTQQSQIAHQKAAEEHKKAHEFAPDKGHDQQAAMHTAQAQAAQAVNQSMNSPHQGSDIKAAHDASFKAHRASQSAHAANTPEAHTAAAKAHEEAINQHMEIHGARESDEDGHHGQIAKTHMALHAYHSAKAKGEQVAKATHEHYAGEFSGKPTFNHPDQEIARASRKATDASSVAATHAHNARTEADDADSQEGRRVTRAAHDATNRADLMTTAAHSEDGNHKGAAEAHYEAAEAHDTAAGHYDDEDNHAMSERHQKIAKMHEDIASDHEGIHRRTAVAKAEGGPMTITPTTTDLAAKTGGEALAVEGRPDEKDMAYCDKCDTAYPKGSEHECKGGEVAKAHVESHTRTVGGKVVQVQSYDTHHAAAMKASSAAHAATAGAQNPQHHVQAAASHMKAAEGHREAAKYAPEDWQKKGHEDNAKLHEHYAKAHHAKAKAADLHADTGVDTPMHTAQDIKELENHDDYAGFGYLGHQDRNDASDKALAEAASKAKISKHELAAHILGRSGRFMMDDHSFLGEKPSHAERVAHFQRHLTNPKTAKEHGIKEYAEDLKGRDPNEKNKAAAAKEPVTVRAASEGGGYKIPAPKKAEAPDETGYEPATVQHKGKVSTVEFGKNSGRAVLHPEHQESVGKLKHGESDSFEDEQGEKWDVHRHGEDLHFKARGSSGLKGKVKASEFQAFPDGKDQGNGGKSATKAEFDHGAHEEKASHHAESAHNLAKKASSESRHPDSARATATSREAEAASDKAIQSGKAGDHAIAAKAHAEASLTHASLGDEGVNPRHHDASAHHDQAEAAHKRIAEALLKK